MPELELPAGPHPAALPPEQLLAGCEVRRTRASGPGGQHRNKVETAVVITHRESGLSAQASERRSQHANRSAALFRLRIALALRRRCYVAGGAEPSALWQTRASGRAIRVNAKHDDVPALLAEALDRIHAHDDDVGAAANALDVSTSQLVKLLKLEPAALTQVNEARRERGQRPLR